MNTFVMLSESAHFDQGEIRSVPELAAAKSINGEAAAFRVAVASVRTDDIAGLIYRIQTTNDPLLLWVVHLELDNREVPPCLRASARSDSRQMAFITWLADLYWFCKRNPTHCPFFKRWRGIFENRPTTEAWHRTAIWIFRANPRVGHYHAKGLGLSEADRQPLMTMLSNAMRADRDLLKRLPELRDRLWRHAISHPDKSGRRSASDVAERRAKLLRLYLLAGKNRTTAARWHTVLTNEPLTRQTLSRQLDAIELATGLRRLGSR